ncbi:maleylpyruvate isomerase family mycothiol-dependent enzyme [Egibacter rhizosphaerae]|uniref:Maleylpyruvate isomerase family mycothiol-dependent enzyme n=1 Tax=Egibacter rhizosphaerae TaxID=1670831 RepID=A0A411YEV9_9ACTN|nr:maleylpyruvate isomerase family mycothiol-dependent enzyme [Egibacter rhizosphaerae]QBI19793.1 maleylpyruvate isomerase family mycothiol-dependent enzyme [Egibacter rhizosphaerae]
MSDGRADEAGLARAFGPRLDVRDRFGPQRSGLLATLRGLDGSEWTRPTACPGWTVADVAAHLLGTDLSRLARTRDEHPGPGPASGEPLTRFIDRHNAQWVEAAQRLSPRLLVELLAWTGPQIADLWAAAELDALGEEVSWAGPGAAPVWLDAARDLTEVWVHHQQIWEAVGLPVEDDPATLQPILDTFLRALPHTLADTPAPAGSRLAFVVPEPAGGRWTVTRDTDGWGFEERPEAGTSVTLDADTTWRLAVRMTDPHTARSHARIDGDQRLGEAALELLAIIREG